MAWNSTAWVAAARRAAVGAAVAATASLAFAEERTVTTYPDGRRVESTTVTTGADAEAVSLGVVALGVLLGGCMTWFGFRLIWRGMDLGSNSADAEISIDVAKRSFSAKKITQGAVMAILGFAVILVSLALR